MFSSNTETGITATYQDADGTVDLVLNDAITVATSVTTPLVDAAIVDGENFKINGAQGSDGQLMTSTGSGVAWEDAPASGPSTGKVIALSMIF